MEMVPVHRFDLTGSNSVATTHVRLPMPTLKAMVYTTRMGIGSSRRMKPLFHLLSHSSLEMNADGLGRMVVVEGVDVVDDACDGIDDNSEEEEVEVVVDWELERKKTKT